MQMQQTPQPRRNTILQQLPSMEKRIQNTIPLDNKPMDNKNQAE